MLLFFIQAVAPMSDHRFSYCISVLLQKSPRRRGPAHLRLSWLSREIVYIGGAKEE